MKPKQKSTIIILAVLVLAVIFFIAYTQKPATKYTNQDELTKAITNLRACSQDSDCTTTYDCAFTTAINKQYKTIWENTSQPDRCAVMGAVVCVYHSQGYNCTIDEYVAKCLNNVCEAKHITELA